MVETGNNLFIKIVITAVLALFLTVAHANAELEIVVDSISPQPVEPGQDVIISVTLVNENQDINDVLLSVRPDSYLRLKDENDRIISAGRIIKYGAKAETCIFHVDPDALSGIYEVEFNARWSGNDQQRETNKTVKVLVKGVPRLVISNITVSPEKISPQDMFDLTFSVSNKGTGIARDVQVSIVTDELPFVASGVNTRVLSTLDPDETGQLSYQILVKDRADISSFSLPIRMEYKDENGRNITSQGLVGIKVLGRAKLSIANIRTEPQNPAKDDLVTVTMRIENSGTGDAKSAKVTFITPFEGNKTAFLGKIKPDDDAPAVFTFLAAESGDIPYSATIEFEDDLGMHTGTWSLNQYIYGRNGKNLIAPGGVIALTAGTTAYFLFRRKKQAG